MRPKLALTLVVVVLATLVSGCNIFSWTKSDTAESLIEEGKAHLRDAEYNEALEKFAEAIEKEPNNSTALYYHAKAAVHASGFNSLSLAQMLADDEFIAGDDFPFTGNDWPKNRANDLYQVSAILMSDLKPIWDEETTGEFGKTDIDFDLALAAGMRGILMFQDSNLDGVIDGNDYNFLLEYIDDISQGFEISDFHDYIASLSSAPKLKALSPQDTIAIDPGIITAFNMLVDNINEILDLAEAIIISIASGTFGLDPLEVKSVLDEARATAYRYRVADGVDNDGDGRTDEEVVDGIDNDGDGLTDEDSNGTWSL